MFTIVQKELCNLSTYPHFKRTMLSRDLKEIFLKSVESVQPQNLIRNTVKVANSHLWIKNEKYLLHKPCYLVGFGKAVLGMALEMEQILSTHLQRAIVSVPRGIFKDFPLTSSTQIEFYEGANNNIPDEDAMNCAIKIRELVENLSIDDLLVVLISGGGSALLPLPKPPVNLREKQELILELGRKGADITELNCVRKQISVLKGGGLASIAAPARVVSLILSDVIDDPLDIIASGPTMPYKEDPSIALNVIKKYLEYDKVAESIRKLLEQSELFCSYGHVTNYIIGNNKIAAERAKEHAISLGYQSEILSTEIRGDVVDIGEIYAKLACDLANRSVKIDNLSKISQNFSSITNLDMHKPICLVAAGEPTVVVQGDGKGGRNQQLALEFSVQLHKFNIKFADISFLSAGTDGIDGPTDAAGAIGTLDLVNNSLQQNIKPQDYLANNDSYSFYSRFNGGDFLVKTGHTGTNVMDIHLIALVPQSLF